MLDQIIYEIVNLKGLIITSVVVSAIIFTVIYFLLNKFSWNIFRVKTFSLLCNFNLIDCICLGIILSRFIYVVYFSIDNSNIGVEHLITLLLMSIIICLLQKDFINLATNIFSSLVIYVIIYLSSTLKYFYYNVESDLVVIIMAIMLMIFSILFAIYSLISSYNHLLIRDKKSKNLESLENVKKIKWPRIKRNGKLKSSS